MKPSPMRRALGFSLAILTCVSAFALEQPKLTTAQIQELDERDAELSGKILGVWVFESMGPDFRHVGQRTVYREDGTFVADYRISSAGEISYRRSTGLWYPLMGWFCEEETRSSDDRLIPRMVRWVNDPIEQELRMVSRSGMEAVLIRGEAVAEEFDNSLAGLSAKDLDAALAAKNMLGFVPDDTGKKDADGEPLYRWIIKSRLLQQEE